MATGLFFVVVVVGSANNGARSKSVHNAYRNACALLSFFIDLRKYESGGISSHSAGATGVSRVDMPHHTSSEKILKQEPGTVPNIRSSYSYRSFILRGCLC